ncbi:MAG: complex I NDUFA9 subunit family protein [Candidatus Paracaedimonas acanthamoebae]|uniref:Complex I NDUFA9 subunit family protein n=1 Tax=Candidatus Paracaedimonas acanthamoebae TaxID=244581 RepID=A0A8J7TV68_9PROT|nr:complex I NDUFA9 subunit family protein [Candidatus Paracaedimonas acanthamoebae]
MQGKYITIFGGTGFIGRSLVQKFAREGAIIRVPVRSPNNALFLKTMGHVGQITLCKINPYIKQDIEACCENSEIVINLIGIFYEKKNSTFKRVHVELAETIAESTAKAGAKRFLHMSALGADSRSKSAYAISKIQGEQAVLKAYPQATIFRPSLVFGPHDRFFNRFSEISRFSPILPLIGGGKTHLQPTYVGDVIEAVIVATKYRESEEQIYELGGPKIYSFKELFEIMLKIIQLKRLLLPLPYFIARIIGFFGEFLPTPPLTRDQVKFLEKDNILTKRNLTFQDLGLVPHALESILPRYLSHYK